MLRYEAFKLHRQGGRSCALGACEIAPVPMSIRSELVDADALMRSNGMEEDSDDEEEREEEERRRREEVERKRREAERKAQQKAQEEERRRSAVGRRPVFKNRTEFFMMGNGQTLRAEQKRKYGSLKDLGKEIKPTWHIPMQLRFREAYQGEALLEDRSASERQTDGFMHVKVTRDVASRSFACGLKPGPAKE